MRPSARKPPGDRSSKYHGAFAWLQFPPFRWNEINKPMECCTCVPTPLTHWQAPGMLTMPHSTKEQLESRNEAVGLPRTSPTGPIHPVLALARLKDNKKPVYWLLEHKHFTNTEDVCCRGIGQSHQRHEFFIIYLISATCTCNLYFTERKLWLYATEGW